MTALKSNRFTISQKIICEQLHLIVPCPKTAYAAEQARCLKMLNDEYKGLPTSKFTPNPSVDVDISCHEWVGKIALQRRMKYCTVRDIQASSD
jgi:hypothetical protein